MTKILLFTLLFFSFNTHSQPLTEAIEEVQLYFGQLANFKCCTLVQKKARAPYKGFLLTPYQLVFLKDTIDTWELELTQQLKLADDLCNVKIKQCQENRDEILSEVKSQAIYYEKTADNLTIINNNLKNKYFKSKIISYIAIPVALLGGIYVGYKVK
jgi:hypothetical protein